MCVHQKALKHVHNMGMEFPHAKDKNNGIQLWKKCAEFLSAMTRNKRIPSINIEGEGVVLGYDHIASIMNSK